MAVYLLLSETHRETTAEQASVCCLLASEGKKVGIVLLSCQLKQFFVAKSTLRLFLFAKVRKISNWTDAERKGCDYCRQLLVIVALSGRLVPLRFPPALFN